MMPVFYLFLIFKIDSIKIYSVYYNKMLPEQRGVSPC